MNDLAKPTPPMSARRFQEVSTDGIRYESSNSINNRPNRWPTLTQTQISNGRLTTAEEKARRSQAEYYKLLSRDMPSDEQEKQRLHQQQSQVLDDDILLTSSSFFPHQQPLLENPLEEEYAGRYSSMPSCQSTDVNEPILPNESRDAFTATYLLRRLNTLRPIQSTRGLERESSTNVSSSTYPMLAPSSRVDDETIVQVTTDNETELNTSRTAVFDLNDDGRQLTSTYVTNRLTSHLNERLIGISRPSTRPKSTSSALQNRTVLDVRCIQPPIPPANQRRNFEQQQQYQKPRGLMVFGKQNTTEVVEKMSSISSRAFHLSIHERRPDDSATNQDNSSSIVSKLCPIPTDNMSMNLASRYDLSSLNRAQTMRASSVKKSSK